MFKVNDKDTRTTPLVHLEKAIEIRVDDLLQVIKTNDKFLT